jgi:hypothetical protein
VSNGAALLVGVDGRSTWVRRCKDVIALHLSDLGGSDNCSEAERSIIRRCAVITTELERLELKFAKAGEASDSDLDLYQRTAGNLRRLFDAIGIKRRPKDVTTGPTFGDLWRADQAQQREREAQEREALSVPQSEPEGSE